MFGVSMLYKLRTSEDLESFHEWSAEYPHLVLEAVKMFSLVHVTFFLRLRVPISFAFAFN